MSEKEYGRVDRKLRFLLSAKKNLSLFGNNRDLFRLSEGETERKNRGEMWRKRGREGTEEERQRVKTEGTEVKIQRGETEDPRGDRGGQRVGRERGKTDGRKIVGKMEG